MYVAPFIVAVGATPLAFLIVSVLPEPISIPSLKLSLAPIVALALNSNIALSFMYNPDGIFSLIVAIPPDRTLLSIKHSYPCELVLLSPLLYNPPAPIFPQQYPVVSPLVPVPFVAVTLL